MREILIPPALAQAPEISSLLPAGGARGSTVTIHLDGKNLQGAKVFLAGRGIRTDSATVNDKADSAEIKLTIAADAPIGPRELRIGSTKGVSNPVRIWVDVFPNQTEVEPNDDIAHAQPIPRTPVVVNGRIQAATDRDTFVFRAAAGETWVFDCNAARLRSRLDPVLELRDEKGQTLQTAQSTWESDPRLIHKFASAGRYFITVRDTQFQGGPDFVYRLTVGAIPTITGFRPHGERAGHKVDLYLQGVNLASGRAVVTIPSATPPGPYWTVAETPRGPTLPISLLVEDQPVAGITETDATMPLPQWPVSLDGAFIKYPRARFFFLGGPTDHFLFDLLGRRIGSRIDGAIRILDLLEKELASNDDAIGKDARLVFTPPTDGVYIVEIRNVDEKTGPSCYYRLDVRNPAPDFRLMLDMDRLIVGAGGTTAFTVEAERISEFDGPIALRAEGLPTGVKFSGGQVPQGQTKTEVTLTAAPDTTLDAKQVHIVGEATIDGKTSAHNVVPRDQYMPRSIDPGMFTDDSYRKPYRAWDLLLLGVTERAEPFALSTEPATITLTPGQKVEIVLRADRRPGADGEIKLELRGLPDKVTAAALPIAAKQTESRITVTAAPDAPAAVRNLIILGHLDKATQPAPAIQLTVQK